MIGPLCLDGDAGGADLREQCPTGEFAYGGKVLLGGGRYSDSQRAWQAHV